MLTTQVSMACISKLSEPQISDNDKQRELLLDVRPNKHIVAPRLLDLCAVTLCLGYLCASIVN